MSTPKLNINTNRLWPEDAVCVLVQDVDVNGGEDFGKTSFNVFIGEKRFLI